MTPSELDRVRHRLEEFFTYCFDEMGRSERRAALGTYLRGLLLDGERKCMMPMARRLTNDQSKVAATRQRIHEAVTAANWDEAELYRRLAIRVSKKLPGIEAFVLDDTGFAKKGKHSAGVHRQYSGTLGRVDNCQVATSLHLASESGGACIGAQLFLPQAWADAPERRKKAGIPDDIEHHPKWQIGLNLLERALEWGMASHVVLADSGYGDCTAFRQALEDRDLGYVVGVSSGMSVWPPGVCPTPPPPRKANAGVGRPKVRWTAPEGQLAVSLEILAETMPASYFRKVTWNKGRKSGRFAALRLRSAHKSTQGAAPGEEQWLLIEWAADKDKPRKFYLSNLPADTKLSRLVYLAKLRWRIERDYQEMKGELGLDHFEGRGWRGFHHHFACVAAAHAFLTLERALFSPEDRSNHPAAV